VRPAEILYLPASGKVNALTARLLQSDLEELSHSTIKPYIDFDHSGKAAAADPKRFVWKPGHGVFLRLAWTRSGRAAVEGKDYRYFSPAVRIDDKGEIDGLPLTVPLGLWLISSPSPPLSRR
jgi:phage I-like protein